MSEEAATTSPAIVENGEKSAETEATTKMASMNLGEKKEEENKEEKKETAEQPTEAGQDATCDPRENGDDGFHTPEATGEVQQKEGNDDKEENKEEKESETKLDDDEIEDNPAYIPRKGRYYMHDSRDAEEEVEEEKRTSRADGAWKHDRFDERWQRPKTRKQIMTRYGFDIREGETQEEAEENQRKRLAEKTKKDTDETEKEVTAEKRRVKKAPPRAKPRPRTEKSENVLAKTRPQKTQKLEKTSTDKQSPQEGEERITKNRNEDDDDDDIHAGQRRQVRQDHRRERHERTDVRVVRNVRGSRGGLSGHRADRHPPANYRSDRDRYRDRDGEGKGYRREQRYDDRNYENHRRGVMRGSVRGASSYTRGQPTRTFTALNHGPDSSYQREEVPPQRNAGYSPRALDNGTYYDTRGSYIPRGGYTGRGRGAMATSPRGGYSPRGDGYPTRGFTGPKRYSEQRGEIIPPTPIAVPPPIPPPQHNFSIPRQPTDVVYFDPTQQPSRQPLPPREKKIIEIVPPSN